MILSMPASKWTRRLSRVASGMIGYAMLNCALLAHAEPPLGSRAFLGRHVHSVTELKRELNRDPRLLRIYSELLHMTSAQVKAEFARLKLQRLDDEGVYKVYGVYETPAGLQYSFKVRRLPKGIEVFTLEDGKTPVILKQCGNLLRGYYPSPGPIADSVPAFNEVNPDADLPATPSLLSGNVTLDTPISHDWGWVEDTTATEPAPAVLPPPGLSHHVPPAWWPWLFPLIGVPFIGSGGGGGGGNVSTFWPFPLFIPGSLTSSAASLAGIVETNFDVPEPGAVSWLFSLSGAGAGLVLWRMRRNSRERRRRN